MQRTREREPSDAPCSDEYRFQLVSHQGLLGTLRVADAWMRTEHWTQRALRGTRGNIDVLREGVLRGSIMLWLVLRGQEEVGVALIQEVFSAVEREPGLRVVSVAGAGGRHWVPLLHSLLAEQVRAGHYTAVVASCRPGMMRWLSRLGWKVRRFEMEYRAHD